VTEIARDQIGGCWVRTVFDGVTYATTTFWDWALNDYPDNPRALYGTEGEALEGHGRAVADIREGRPPWFTQ
jgi:hypothetical protein